MFARVGFVFFAGIFEGGDVFGRDGYGCWVAADLLFAFWIGECGVWGMRVRGLPREVNWPWIDSGVNMNAGGLEDWRRLDCEK